ncbi:Basic-leucine zipper [Gracilaria domingensis]|nr:Basic-leucine zipper [Gracilaria domingensis]
MLFVSAFNRGLYTAGFEICHRKKAAQAVTLNNRYVARTVRDDHNGQLFSVAHHPPLGVTEIAFCHPQTPGHRRQGILMFRTDLFNNIVTNLRNGNAVDFKALRYALAYAFVATEWRQCPNCQSYNSQFCGCAVESRLKVGPNDFHHDRDSLFLHGGSYNGVVTVSMFALPGAPPLMQRTVRSSSCIGLLQDDAEAHSMCTWAMSTLSDKYPADLVHMNFLNGRDARQESDASEQLVQYDDAADLCLDLEDPLAFFADNARSVAVQNDNGMTELQSVLNGMQRICSEAACSIVGQQKSIEAVNSADLSTIRLFLGNNNADDDQTPSFISARSPQDQQAVDEELSRALANTTTSANISQLAAQRHSMSTTMSNACTVEDALGTSIRKLTPPTISGTSLVRTAPTAVPIAPACSDAVKNRSAALDANQIRMERRKARNRASAQRSNLKKRLAMQKMKEELAELSERQSQLRVEERELREENLRLRAEMPNVGRLEIVRVWERDGRDAGERAWGMARGGGATVPCPRHARTHGACGRHGWRHFLSRRNRARRRTDSATEFP